MSGNTKNYAEQGGERLVIGGEIEFKEGARVTGLPTALILDFQGQDLIGAIKNEVDVTDLIPLDVFLEASQCTRPIIIRGLSFNNGEVGVQGMATKTNQGIYAMAGVNGVGARLYAVVTFLLYASDDRVWMIADVLPLYDDEDMVQGVDVDPGNATMTIGEELQISAQVFPGTAMNRTLRWNTSNDSVVTLNVTPDEIVDESTAVYATAVGEGTAEITVTTEENGYTATCFVEVNGEIKKKAAK